MKKDNIKRLTYSETVYFYRSPYIIVIWGWEYYSNEPSRNTHIELSPNVLSHNHTRIRLK